MIVCILRVLIPLDGGRKYRILKMHTGTSLVINVKKFTDSIGNDLICSTIWTKRVSVAQSSSSLLG